MSASLVIGIVLVVLLAIFFVLLAIYFVYSWVSESRELKRSPKAQEINAWWEANAHRFDHLSGIERHEAIVAALRAEFGPDYPKRTR